MSEAQSKGVNKGIIWVVAIIVVVGLVVGYQVLQNNNSSGGSQINGNSAGTGDKEEDGRGTNDQTGKPGEAPKN